MYILTPLFESCTGLAVRLPGCTYYQRLFYAFISSIFVSLLFSNSFIFLRAAKLIMERQGQVYHLAIVVRDNPIRSG